MISWLFLYSNVPWMSAVWFLVVDIFLVLYMRDSALMFFNVFIGCKSIIEWQSNGVKIGQAKQNKNLSIVCPLNGTLSFANMENDERIDNYFTITPTEGTVVSMTKIGVICKGRLLDEDSKQNKL